MSVSSVEEQIQNDLFCTRAVFFFSQHVLIIIMIITITIIIVISYYKICFRILSNYEKIITITIIIVISYYYYYCY